MTYRYLRYAYEAPETRNWLPDFWPSLWLRPRVTALADYRYNLPETSGFAKKNRLLPLIYLGGLLSFVGA